jgi:Ca2+-binding RTX toxin-like protein
MTSSTTSAVANINDLPTGSVTISGTPTQGQTLSAANTLADLDGLGAISYQWSAGGIAITGATQSTYVLSQAEVGKTITVAASYIDLFSHAESVSSSATASVANINDLPTGSVTITGAATQGQTLTAANTLADLDGLGQIHYQWQAAGVNISGATASTLVLGQTEVGQTITAVAHYTDTQGTTESVVSSASTGVLGFQDGTAGNDVLTGSAFADTLNPGTGSDIVHAGAGNDTLNLTSDGTWSSGFAAANQNVSSAVGTGQQVLLEGKVRFADIVDGGDGADTVQLTNGNDAFFLHDAYSLFNANAVLANDAQGKLNIARVSAIENIHGGAGDDIIDLTSTDYTIAGVSLFGEAGNDILWGNIGNDTLQGVDGNDTLFGGAGNNTLNGGAGADLFQYAKGGTAHDTIEDFQVSTDKIQLYGATSAAEVSMAVNGDHVTLTWGAQTIDLLGITSIAGADAWLQLA